MDFPLTDREIVLPRSPFLIGKIMLEAFPVEHSIRSPAVGYRITAGRSSIFYVPDVVYIPESQSALQGIRAYIGDGASLRRPMVRSRNGKLFGHAAVRTQLGWCRKAGVRSAFITHCGSEIVGSDWRTSHTAVEQLGQEFGINAQLAWDGLVVRMP